jgi:redox-sensitive bicupin YhaK (pirin superfamily)
MIDIRRAETRGAIANDWLDARFSFSFGGYQDPDRIQWGPLRALNDDIVQPARGFAPHGHTDIETITYPLYGRIEHRDSLGNHHVYGRGQIQRMSAGRGIVHSETNPSPTEPERHLQIWFLPARSGGDPECELSEIPDSEKQDRWRIIASPDGRAGSARVRQDVMMYACMLGAAKTLAHKLEAGRIGYLHLVSGCLRLADGTELKEGDAVCLNAGAVVEVEAIAPAEALLFDLVT